MVLHKRRWLIMAFLLMILVAAGWFFYDSFKSNNEIPKRAEFVKKNFEVVGG